MPPPLRFTSVGMTRKNRKDDDGERRVSRYIRMVRAVFKVCRNHR